MLRAKEVYTQQQQVSYRDGCHTNISHTLAAGEEPKVPNGCKGELMNLERKSVFRLFPLSFSLSLCVCVCEREREV